MRRLLTPILTACCLAALLLACYGPALFAARQFGFRDAVQYYYPLYQRVQDEWAAGRVPLWEPGENSGMPLLGNPTAAVLYPGKLLYAVLPYPWAARLYIVAHTALAFAAMAAMLRSWGASATASGLSGLSYAFGAPILFQYCNVVYLVGAAWTPLGFRAADRWLRQGRRPGLLELAVVLAMLVLGGDPESAYVLGVCAVGYALVLAWSRDRTSGPVSPGWRNVLAGMLFAAALAGLWVAVTLELARRLPALRPPQPVGLLPRALPWMRWWPMAVSTAWGAAGLFVLVRWRRGGRSARLGTMLLGLTASAALAAALSAAQLLPVLEFSGQTARAADEGRHDIYPFSLEPVRTIELVCPNVFGSRFLGNRSWLEAFRAEGSHVGVWVPSLYLGGLTLVLAVGAMGFRGDGPGRGWLTAVAVVSLLASYGEYTGPLWWARHGQAGVARLGPHDPAATPSIRADGRLRDGDGGFYWLLANALPGFRQFRYPSKLLSFTALGISGLAGLGWDRVCRGRGWRRTVMLAATGLATGLVVLGGVVLQRPRVVATLGAIPASRFQSSFGPFDAERAYRDLCLALVHGSVVLAAAPLLAVQCRRRPAASGVAALLLMTADLAAANARYVLTVPQSVLDATPRAVRIIEDAERAAGRPGPPASSPFRVHRMPGWTPDRLAREAGGDHRSELVAWERDTLNPKYGLPYGIQYTLAFGAVEPSGYDRIFAGFRGTIDADTAARLGARGGQEVVVYPRRSFDLWNTRYFVVPAHARGWDDPARGYASFLNESERIDPPPDAFRGPAGPEHRRRWSDREDYQVFRNRAAFPRAWVVHSARFLAPTAGSDPVVRLDAIREMTYSADALWYIPGRRVYDPHLVAWLDPDRRSELAEFLPDTAPRPGELPTITGYGPQRVEIDVTLDQPGLVVLSDLFYPGWRLTIDGAPAPIHRANLLMRAAAVRAGQHHLDYTYEPLSFRIGLGFSALGLAVLALLGLRRPYRGYHPEGSPQIPGLISSSRLPAGSRK